MTSKSNPEIEAKIKFQLQTKHSNVRKMCLFSRISEITFGLFVLKKLAQLIAKPRIPFNSIRIIVYIDIKLCQHIHL